VQQLDGRKLASSTGTVKSLMAVPFAKGHAL